MTLPSDHDARNPDNQNPQLGCLIGLWTAVAGGLPVVPDAAPVIVVLAAITSVVVMNAIKI